jgi:hypothetical protein
MRAILALGLLITLCASANAATVHHRRHANVGLNQGVILGPASGFAYAPAGPQVHYGPAPAAEPPTTIYENRYKNWGG